TQGASARNRDERLTGQLVYYAMRQHAVDAVRDRKELAWTAFVAKTGSGVFRVPRPPVSTKWLMRNVGSLETSEALAVEDDEPKKSAVELDGPKKRSLLQGKISVRPMPHRSKEGRRVSIVIMAAGVLTVLFFAWKYIWPLLR